MAAYTYDLSAETGPNLGLVVLQTDERIERDFRRLIPDNAGLFVSRVPSGLDVSPETLAGMEAHIPAAAGLLPNSVQFDAIGYGCTSGTAQIGAERIATLVRQGAQTQAVTEPLSALVAACGELGVNRLAFLSPYVDAVSERLRDALRAQSISTPVFGTFAEAEEAKVVRISADSIYQAAMDLSRQGDVDALFLSCTNLNTLDVIDRLEAKTGLPVLSSNLVLARHMCRLAGTRPVHAPGRIARR